MILSDYLKFIIKNGKVFIEIHYKDGLMPSEVITELDITSQKCYGGIKFNIIDDTVIFNIPKTIVHQVIEKEKKPEVIKPKKVKKKKAVTMLDPFDHQYKHRALRCKEENTRTYGYFFDDEEIERINIEKGTLCRFVGRDKTQQKNDICYKEAVVTTDSSTGRLKISYNDNDLDKLLVKGDFILGLEFSKLKRAKPTGRIYRNGLVKANKVEKRNIPDDLAEQLRKDRQEQIEAMREGN